MFTRRRLRQNSVVVALILCSGVALGDVDHAESSFVRSRPHIIVMLQDDLGYYDMPFNGNSNMALVAANISRMATDGIVLGSHYVHYWCSPTRRAFLTGRLPIHQGEALSDSDTDDIDLRWSLISDKLRSVGYRCVWYGKGHTGFKSMAHLPTSRGFDDFIGFLEGSQSYRSSDRWSGRRPTNVTTYSTTLFGDAAVARLASHDPRVPMFMYLGWQAVHEPYDPVPDWSGDIYQGMIWKVDSYVGVIRSLLEAKNMWNNTLILYSTDNGGTVLGVNYPLRGEKCTNYEGGIRAAAFLSGGIIPVALRNTRSQLRIHIVDWYTTFCVLAGADPSDNAPIAPLPVDPTNPQRDIYQGNRSWPGVDGVNVWPSLMLERHGVAGAHDLLNARLLVTSAETVFWTKWKLLLGPTGDAYSGPLFHSGWQLQNGTWVFPKNQTQNCGNLVWPCLFDIESDPSETVDLSRQQPGVVRFLWSTLNTSLLTYYVSRSPSPLLGPCNSACANRHWTSEVSDWTADDGPICGVPGCPVAAPPKALPVSSKCEFVNGTGLSGPSVFDNGETAIYEVQDKYECCGLCEENPKCVAADLHPGIMPNADPRDPLYCHLKLCSPQRCPVHNQPYSVACVPTTHAS